MTTDRSPIEAVREMNAFAVRAMTAGDFGTAREILQRVVQIAPKNAAVWLNFAGCCRALSDISGALAAVEMALKSDPRSFPGLLMKGSLLEGQGSLKQAAKMYGFAIALAPPESTLDAATANALQHAREVNERHVEELVSFVDSELGPLRGAGDSYESKRINKFIDFVLRRKPAFRQEPSEFFYPGLPAIEFYERDEFPWIEDLEHATSAIQGELRQILQDDFRDFLPYVNYAEGLPLDQWAELNHSRKWGALHLYLSGKRMEENCRRAPQTVAALQAIPQPHMPKRSPAAMFSVLQPKTHIPPHTGVANTRLVVHLPLIVPDGCGFRVGNEERQWREGEAWVFDDTIEHEAWNNSALPRVIMICDIWHPQLSQTERDLIVGVVSAMDKFNEVVPKPDL